MSKNIYLCYDINNNGQDELRVKIILFFIQANNEFSNINNLVNGQVVSLTMKF